MDFDRLINQAPDYREAPLSSVTLEQQVARARSAHRRRLQGFHGLSAEHDSLRAQEDAGSGDASTVWDVVGAALGPGDVAPHLRSLLSQAPVLSPAAEGNLGVHDLEARLEAAQIRVLRVAHHIDRLDLDRAALRAEMTALRTQMEGATGDAQRAADAILALKKGLDRIGLEPGWEHKTLTLERLLTQRGDELRAYQRTADRLASILALHHEFLKLSGSLGRGLSDLHVASTDVLNELDQQLVRAAVKAQAADMARAVKDSMEGLHESVARVNRLSSQSAVLLTENLDRLAEEVDLLAPADPDKLVAEEEVNQMLRGSVDDLVKAARNQVALRKRVADLLDLDDG